MGMQGPLSPGVYRDEITIRPAPQLNTGVPIFLGQAMEGEAVNLPVKLTLWPQFADHFSLVRNGFLADAVKGFFQNGGTLCYVSLVKPASTTTDMVAALKAALESAVILVDIDLVCAPDVMLPLVQFYRKHQETPSSPTEFEQSKQKHLSDINLLQRAIIDHCDQLNNRFAILDSLPCVNSSDPLLCASPDDVLGQKQNETTSLQRSANAALYYPWLRLSDSRFVPPCGHIAGIYARTDHHYGVHKAPANEVIEGIVDLSYLLDNPQNGELYEARINCLRVFPGRGARVWGARTLSSDPNWVYVNVRRLFITAGRWIDLNMAHTIFEPNSPSLWAQIERDLTTYFKQLFQNGALQGAVAEEAFYVRCNAETNPPEVREQGWLIAEIGLAPTVPNEFVWVRIIRNTSGIQIEL